MHDLPLGGLEECGGRKQRERVARVGMMVVLGRRKVRMAKCWTFLSQIRRQRTFGHQLGPCTHRIRAHDVVPVAASPGVNFH